MLCGSASLLKSSDSHTQVKPARCRCWSCAECAPLRRARLEMEIEAGAPDTHIVLTLRRTPGGDPNQARKRLGKAVPEFFRRVERETRVHVHRFNVTEATKAGWPHIHVAVRGWTYLLHKRLCQIWREVTGDSDHVRVRRVPAKKLKRYLAKYLGKDLHKFGDSKRYWRTKGWLPADFGEPDPAELEQWQGWSFDKRHREEIAAEYQRDGYFRHDLGDGSLVLTPPPWRWRPAALATGPPS